MSVVVTNTTASLSGKTLAKLEDAQTITGLKLFDLGASAPFAVVSGAAKVDNLDSDKLDGENAVDFHNAALLTGLVPPASIAGADPNADRVVFWDDSAGAYAYLALLGTAIRTTNLTLAKAIPNGRLTLTTAVPVTTADVTAATTLYWALYGGNTIALYNGTAWENFIVAELSIAVPATTATGYDVFIDYNSGTPALALTAWSSLTARATNLTTQDGVLVLTGSTGKRYVGSFRTTGVSGQTEDSFTKRYVWNYYNRVQRALVRTDATATWNYTTATIRQANGSTANQVEVFVGVAEVPIDLSIVANVISDSSGVQLAVGIGEDSTTTFNGAGIYMQQGTVSVAQSFTTRMQKYPAIGHHFYSWNEASTAVGTTTWVGTVTILGGTVTGGLRGWIEG